MTATRAWGRVLRILRHEPSWFAELGSAAGFAVWSVLALLTHDYRVQGWAFVIPVIGLILGPTRIWLLFHLLPVPRVLAACAGFVLWVWIAASLVRAQGALPAEGPDLALALLDLLTVSKFSFAARDQGNA